MWIKYTRQDPVVQTLDNAVQRIQWISVGETNHAIRPLDGDLSGG